MNKNILLLVAVIVTQQATGQISTTKVAPAKPTKVAAYDSLTNFLGNEYAQYKGQDLYLLPTAESLRQYGYAGFVLDPNKSSIDEKNTFKCCESYNSKYEALQAKYFTVLDVMEDPKSSVSPYAYLKLQMKETGEIVYFKYGKKYSHSFPFLVVGYYEKQKQIFIGNNVLIRPFPIIKGANQMKTVDITTGEEIQFEIGKYVKCIDVTVDEQYYKPSLMLENEKGQKYLFGLNARYLNISRILTQEEAESYRKKFGQENWNVILNEKVAVGFTEEMARFSWGEPEKINRSSSGDQWVYDGTYLYFEGGIMKSFN